MVELQPAMASPTTTAAVARSQAMRLRLNAVTAGKSNMTGTASANVHGNFGARSGTDAAEEEEMDRVTVTGAVTGAGTEEGENAHWLPDGRPAQENVIGLAVSVAPTPRTNGIVAD